MRISDWSSDVCSSDLSYYANLVGGAYSEMRSEAPARYADDVAKFPERRVEFWKSAFSWRIGAPCYTSCESRSEEHTSELQSLMRISSAVFSLKKNLY